ncbi:citrate/2-methylcitrate synthase [Clostridium sp. HCP1S3_B4]|uniref:citrate/2-methylcitrate synthase n=1 Tax=unclassified Clostridium TaxID=2614128 RepID=UPI002A7D617A|nr:citrate/2-methylcitrate synthase [Clostridiales bacterium]MDY2730461.1 citrate/2-methylcitrate synthase [Clostridium sp.]
MLENNFSEITDEILKLNDISLKNNTIDQSLYSKHKVKKGLRDENGKGVLTGLTDISEVQGKKLVDGIEVPADGELYYRGYCIDDLVNGFVKDKRFGFEETTYLLMFGELPNKEELKKFTELLASYRTLPTSFVRDIIMKAPSFDMMNTLARSVLTLYSYDENANDISIPNVIRQCLQLVALFPLLSVYGYQAYDYYYKQNSLIIHTPNPELSTAENILYMLRPDSKYTELEARILDLALVLHAEHGGGNNSTFTTHVVSSSGTDTYSAIAAALGSLKGPKHGGANLKVMQMFADLREHVRDLENEKELEEYLKSLLDKKGFDKSGLIYGMGHAIYCLSDPRARIFKGFVEKLSKEKGLTKEFKLYDTVEKIAAKLLIERKHLKGISANIDFYSGFVYTMLGLPLELYTPVFAIARISGWSAHRIEELTIGNKIIRPAYMNIQDRRPYVPMENR